MKGLPLWVHWGGKTEEESQRPGRHPAILCNQYSCNRSLTGSGSFEMPSTFSPLHQGSCLALPSWGGHGPTVSILPCPCSSCIQPFPALSMPQMYQFSFVPELSWHDLIKGWLKCTVQSGSSPHCPFFSVDNKGLDLVGRVFSKPGSVQSCCGGGNEHMENIPELLFGEWE